MKKIVLAIFLASSFCNIHVYSQNKTTEQVQVNIDLNTIKDDKVNVTVTPPKFTTKEVTYHIPKIIPGTYSEDNYGKYIDNFKAYNKKGGPIPVAKFDENSWTITNAKEVTKITYQVKDTFDTESGEGFGKTDIF